MAVSSTNSATDATAAASSLNASTSDAKATSERFLKLLVAQMQNQDPLSPMDNAQVTSQMAQINTVSGIEKLNLTVQGLSSQFAQLQAVQGVSLVGHDVVVPGNALEVADDATAQAGYELAGPADQVKVEILAPSGKVIDTLNLGAQTNGVHSFDWQAGANASTTGLRFRVTATSGSVNTAATTLVRDKVAAVSTANSVFSLELVNAGTVPYSSIKAFN